MSPPFYKYDLDFLEGEPGAVRMVSDFLQAITKHPEYHENRFFVDEVWEGSRHPVRTGTKYWLAEKRGISAITNPQILGSDITGRLLLNGWIEPEPNPQYAGSPKRFTPAAIAWYEQFGGPNDHVVQRAIGRAIQDAGAGGLSESDLGAIAAQLDVAGARVAEQARSLVDLNVLARRGDPASLHLDTIPGRVWVLRDFGPLSELPSGLFLPPAEVPLTEVPSLVRPRSALCAAPGADGPHDVFISYASEDEDAVARPLFDALAAADLMVWFAPITLKIGDSQRGEIDRGIANSRFSVVILSKDYLDKGWTNYEFDGLVIRNVSSEQVLLPIWHNITKQDVIDFSPSLADKVARKTADRTVH